MMIFDNDNGGDDHGSSIEREKKPEN